MRKIDVGKTYTLTEKDLDEMSSDYEQFVEEMIAEGKVVITAYFSDWRGSAADKKCQGIFKKHGGDFINCGTWLGDEPERDVEYAVPKDKAKQCKADLKAAGFRVELATAVH